jgi:hypothetical protein
MHERHRFIAATAFPSATIAIEQITVASTLHTGWHGLHEHYRFVKAAPSLPITIIVMLIVMFIVMPIV